MWERVIVLCLFVYSFVYSCVCLSVWLAVFLGDRGCGVPISFFSRRRGFVLLEEEGWVDCLHGAFAGCSCMCMCMCVRGEKRGACGEIRVVHTLKRKEGRGRGFACFRVVSQRG